ncbi:MAG TPA: hypothetical protein VGO11_25150 [Chthoniobacteraceae bacterium]|nr:hypothetical protein [Chthoniobacteraceae bacterium]
MPITTPAQLNAYLEKQGYAPHVSADSVFVPIGGSAAPYTAAFTFSKTGQLQITCQLALLGDFPEAELGKLALAALDANMQISPYAFAVIGAAEGAEVDIHKAPVVLIDTLLTADLNEVEVGYSLDRLLQALTNSRGILKLGLGK